MSSQTHHRLRLMVAAAGALVVIGALAGTASAHNTFVSSDPAEGATLPTSPPAISIVFTDPVPLESASVQVIDQTGVRTDVSGITHGASEAVIVAPLPVLGAGEVTVRWRLVGDDGHPLTGRISFIVGDAAAIVPGTNPPATTAPAAAAAPSGAVPASSDAAGLTAPPVTEPASSDGFSTPGAFRWLLRYASYVAIMAVVAIVLTDRLIWPGVAARPRFKSVVQTSLAMTAVLGTLQLLVLAADISERAPWASFGELDAAVSTDAGVALAIRVVLAGVMWLLLLHMAIAAHDVRWTAIGVAGVVLMGTWAWAGHGRSQRWPELGVPLDIVHHVAAALWIGALAIVGLLALRELDGAPRSRVVGRLSAVAAISVAVIVATGAAQTVRLVGLPSNVFESRHGAFLIAKLAVLAVMLVLAATNRQRVRRQLGGGSGAVQAGVLDRLRRGVLAEFALGLVIVAITASMVVTSPSSNPTEPIANPVGVPTTSP